MKLSVIHISILELNIL